jgi:hypothetical protein
MPALSRFKVKDGGPMSDGVEVRRDGHVLEVTLERGQGQCHRRAHDEPGARRRVPQELHEDKDLRCRHPDRRRRHRIFSAGWDLKALNAGEMQLDNWWETADYGVRRLHRLTENWALNKPVIAAINGLAIGGGLRNGDGLRSADRGRSRRVRAARDAARHRPGRRRVATPAAPPAAQHRDGDVPARPAHDRARRRPITGWSTRSWRKNS